MKPMSCRSLFFTLLVLVTLSCIGGVAHAGDVKLDWTAPTSCADGSALTQCPTTGYEVNTAPDETGALTVKETVAATVQTRSYLGLTPGKYCYAVKTVSNTLKSGPTSTACASVPSLPPKAPSGYSVTVVVTVQPSP